MTSPQTEARRLYRQGLPYTRIARALGMTVTQVRIAVGMGPRR